MLQQCDIKHAIKIAHIKEINIKDNTKARNKSDSSYIHCGSFNNS